MALPPTLYASVLGPRFDELAPVLRRFHGQVEGGAARGEVEVRRGAGPLARLACWVMGAPPAGPGVSVDLRVELVDGVERWTRQFGTDTRPGRPMVTRQWQAGAELVEAVGPSRVHFDLRVEDGGLVFEQRRCTLLGLPIPRVLAPRVEAHARARGRPEQGWEIFVGIRLPLIGLIVSYAGTVRPLAVRQSSVKVDPSIS